MGELRRPSTGLPFERLLHSLFDVAKCCHCLGLPSRLLPHRKRNFARAISMIERDERGRVEVGGGTNLIGCRNANGTNA